MVIKGTQLIESKYERGSRQLLGEYLCRGESMLLYAPAGAGKSFTALMLSVALTTGGDFYGWQVPEPKRVLYIEGNELGALGVAQRIRAIYNNQGITEDENFFLEAPHPSADFIYDVTREDHQRLILDTIKLHKIDVVVYDNLSLIHI